MGQKDPLVEWQREGFEMFGGMMKGIAQDFVRYVMHVQVKEQDDQPKLEPKVINLQTSSAMTLRCPADSTAPPPRLRPRVRSRPGLLRPLSRRPLRSRPRW